MIIVYERTSLFSYDICFMSKMGSLSVIYGFRRHEQKFSLPWNKKL